MNDSVLFPRLGPADTELRLGELQEGRELEPSLSQPRETYAPLGGQPVGESHLAEIRRCVLEALGLPAEGTTGSLSLSASRFDALVGWALHDAARLSRTEAAHEDVWAWLTLVLLPDVALQRFPATSAERFRGGARNVFRRTWWRVEVLGQLAAPDRPGALGEDEYVGVFERVSLGREPNLSRAIVRHLQAWDAGRNRSEYARGLTRAILRDMAHTTPALLDEASADSYVAAIGALLEEQDDGKWSLSASITLAALQTL